MIDNNLDYNTLVQRMYCLTLYNISPIQQGIQSLHAVVEYANHYGDTPSYKRWANVDKTVIILNGGSSISLESHILNLKAIGVDLAVFREPDLFNGITAVGLLADERIWDREKYPDRLPPLEPINGLTPAIHREFDLEFFKKSIGGEMNFQLKEYLSKLKLA